MKLIEPAMEYDRQIQAYRGEFPRPGLSMDGGGSLIRFDSTKDWLDHVERMKRPETLPPDRAPSTQYIFVRESDGKAVGVVQIRHSLNGLLAKCGGHIGYSAAPSERRRGYAAEMLRLALPKRREPGIEKL